LSHSETRDSFQTIEHLDRGGNIASAPADVLPGLPVWALADALRRLPGDELEIALRNKILPIVTIPGLVLHASCGEAAKSLARAAGLKLVAQARAADFLEAARRIHGSMILKEATLGLARRHPAKSARRRFTASQMAVLAWFAAVVVALSLVLPPRFAWASASLVAGLFFLAVIALRILCLMPLLSTSRTRAHGLADADLPVYSVLVPLFRETSVLGQLLTALTHLDYPPGKLDIKLILEESDILMQRAVAGIRLPPQFEVIVVPCGRPQTKPRALNYALRFARGELLTIFDAEDIPEPQQLRLAAETFAALPREVACLQAQLVFYNPNENWLTRQFTIEYATLFGLLLPALANHHLPLPLGGTSNHFRTEILRAAGAWDPFNVTEDADLGLRLARAGYETGTLASRTYEEANVKLINWLRQRARWLKGFLATWLVHMREPARLLDELGPSGFWAAQALTIGVFASALLHPVCTAATFALLYLEPALPEDASLFVTVLAGLNLMILVSGYAVTMIAGSRALRRLGITGWIFPLATMPAYWLLMSAAAWLALWQFIVAPSHWNKTEHGLSSFQRRRRRKT
jgi:glycosyltransferase XagB